MGSIEGVVGRFSDELKKELDRRVEYVAKFREEADRKLKEYEDYLKETVKIALPVNLLEVLAKGGFVKAWEIEKENVFDLGVSVNGMPLDMRPYSDFNRITFAPGKYRVTLIVEKTE